MDAIVALVAPILSGLAVAVLIERW